MIVYYKKLSPNQPVSAVAHFEKESIVVVTAPTNDELLVLAKELHLEEGHLRDALDPFEVPRLEIEQGSYYVFTRFVSKSNEAFKTFPVLLVVTDEFLLVLTQQKNPLTTIFETGSITSLTSQPVDVFIELFMKLSTQFSQAINAINYQINKITYNVEEIENKDIIKLVNFENYLNDFLNIFVQNDGFFQLLLTKKNNTLFSTENEYLEDLSLEIKQLLNRCKSSLKMVTNVRNAYSTILTNNLNQVVKFFTSISVVLMVPTVIASFYGMNVPIPNSNSPLMFLLIIGATIVASLVFVWMLVRKKLL